MKLITVANGTLSICVVPETEMEIMILKDIAKRPVNIQIHDKLQILDKNISDVMVITPQSSVASTK